MLLSQFVAFQFLLMLEDIALLLYTFNFKKFTMFFKFKKMWPSSKVGGYLFHLAW